MRTYDQTQEVVKHRNRRSDNPSNNPDAERDGNPGPNGDHIFLVHAICTREQTDVNRFTGDVALNDTGNDDLDGLIRDREGCEGFCQWIYLR